MSKNIAIEKNKIRIYFYFGSISATFFLVMILSFIYSQSLNHEYHQKINQLSDGIINEKKRFLRNAVERTIFLIESERSQVRKESTSKNLTRKQMDEISIERIGNRIRNLRLIDDGYIWVNKIINYDGGDKYAIRQIHPNLPHTEGQWLSTHTRDIKDNLPYETELNGIKKKGEIYSEYYFKKMNSDKIAHKLSFAKLYKPLDWVIATGVYLDDVDQLIQSETGKMKKTINRQKTHSFIIACLALLISTGILFYFEKQIVALINLYENDIKTYTSSLIEEKKKTETAFTEIKQLKGMFPICSNCKKIRDDKGYWNQIESYIQEHSDATFSHSMCTDCSDKLYGNEDWYIEMKKEEKDSIP